MTHDVREMCARFPFVMIGFLGGRMARSSLTSDSCSREKNIMKSIAVIVLVPRTFASVCSGDIPMTRRHTFVPGSLPRGCLLHRGGYLQGCLRGCRLKKTRPVSHENIIKKNHSE